LIYNDINGAEPYDVHAEEDKSATFFCGGYQYDLDFSYEMCG